MRNFVCVGSAATLDTSTATETAAGKRGSKSAPALPTMLREVSPAPLAGQGLQAGAKVEFCPDTSSTGVIDVVHVVRSFMIRGPQKTHAPLTSTVNLGSLW